MLINVSRLFTAYLACWVIVAVRGQETRAQEPRGQDTRGLEGQIQEPRGQEPRGQEARANETREQELRRQEVRANETREQEPRGQEAPGQETGDQEPQGQEESQEEEIYVEEELSTTQGGENATIPETSPTDVVTEILGRNEREADPTRGAFIENTSINININNNNNNNNNAIYETYDRSTIKTEPSYIIVAPRLARPSTVYRVVVGVLSGSSAVDVNAQMSSSAAHHNTATASIAPGETQQLLLRVPDNGDVESYTLTVEGRRGHALVFRNTTYVHASSYFLTILIHLSRPCFTGNQEVGVRVVLLTTEMKPYQEPIEAFILDPQGIIVKRWISRTPHIGVVSVKFQLPDLPEGGWWRVRVVAKGQIEEKKFLVHKVYQPLFEAIVEMPYYGMANEELISGTLTGSFTNNKPIYGNASLTLYVKQPWTQPDSHFKKVSSIYYEYVDKEVDFNFSMSSVLSVVDQVERAEIKVESVFHDVFTWIKYESASRMRILSSRVHLELVGTEPFVFRPGMPFHAVVSVRYTDGEPLDPGRLALSSVVITATVTTTRGATVTLPQIIIPTTSMDQQGRLETLTLLQMGGKDRGWVDEMGASDEIWAGQGPVWVEREIEELLANYTREQYFAEYREKGIFRFHLDMPEVASTMRLDVVYSDSQHHQADATAHAYSYYSPDKRYLQVSSSTEEAKVGEFAVFHVRSNFPVHEFVYLIMSKGVLVHAATEVTEGDDVVTISVPVSQGMSPRFTFLVYVTSDEAEVIADSMTMPVKAFDNMEVHLNTNQHKDHSKKTVEVLVGAPPGSFYALTCQRSSNYFKQHPNALSISRILDQMTKLEPVPRSVHGVLHKSREGSFADRLVSLPASSYGSDVMAIFQDASLAVLTDAALPLTPGKALKCNLTEGQLDCGDGDCFHHQHLCDGRYQCKNKVDELGCDRMYEDFPEAHDSQEDPLELTSDSLYRLLRAGFIMDSFDTEDVEWCNSEILIGHDGREALEREIAKTAEDWMVEGYAIHEDYGISFTSQPIVFNGDPPFYMSAEGPSVCRRGEQISIRVMVFNLLEQPIQAVLFLHDSPDYLFVHVEEGGEVQHFHPRTSTGQHQHLLFIEGGGAKEVALPLAIVKQSGNLEVTIEAVSQLRRDSETLEIKVMAEGVPVRKHTSLVLDLENRASVSEFLDVPVDENPVITFSIFRRYIYGSPAGSISVSGGVFGPLPEDFFMDHTQVFLGRHFRSTDGVAFNFGATMWTLHYLRLTNNFNLKESQTAFEQLTVQLAGLLRRSTNGGFSMWSFTPPSVWLTAKVVNLLLAAQHEDWENQLYIDPKIIKKSIGFLLRAQSLDGGFREEGDIVLDSKVKKTGEISSIPLTALVLVVLQHSLASLQGVLHAKARDARYRARQFLEQQVPRMQDCYHLALTAYALTETGSAAGDKAAAMLQKMKFDYADMTYWSRNAITIHDRRHENSQKGFLLPREPQQWDAHAVEATGYALLFYLRREGITENTERIMRWLNAIRNWDSAFVSTSDSVVAMEALAEYAFRARLHEIMNMDCNFEVTAQDTSFQVSITNSSLISTRNFQLENVWGHINVDAKGSGQAVVQLDVSWGVDVLKFMDQPPEKKYFDLSVFEKYHQFRNKSIITTTVCTSWAATDIGNTSHAAMLEVETPTGYVFFQPLADEAVLSIQHSDIFSQLRNVHTTDTHIFWQFEYIPSYKQCFSYDIQRWYPAANFTRVRSANVMELFAPEHFEMVMINATPLAALDICEVCGSYQCPYCPAYSAATSKRDYNYAAIINTIGFCFILLFKT